MSRTFDGFVLAFMSLAVLLLCAVALTNPESAGVRMWQSGGAGAGALVLMLLGMFLTFAVGIYLIYDDNR